MESLTSTKWRRHFHAKWSPMLGSVVFDYQWCILIVMSVESSFIMSMTLKTMKNVLCAQRSFQNHHQIFHDQCLEKSDLSQ